VATLLAQWGLIPMLGMGPRTSTLWGMGLAALGVLPIAVGSDLHTIAVGFAVASLGFGMFRPGFTSGASLAVTPREQGQAAGIVTSVNGAAYIAAPAAGVLLYNHSQWLAWGVMEALALSVVALCILAVRKDAV
jgi:predicted MFS family arabinose efflux permease